MWLIVTNNLKTGKKENLMAYCPFNATILAYEDPSLSQKIKTAPKSEYVDPVVSDLHLTLKGLSHFKLTIAKDFTRE